MMWVGRRLVSACCTARMLGSSRSSSDSLPLDWGLVSAEGGTPLTWGVARTDLSLLISCEISTEASDSALLESVGDSFRSVVVWVVSRVFLRPATCAAAGAVRLAVRGFVVMRGLLSSSLKSWGSGSRWIGFLAGRRLVGCLVVGGGLVGLVVVD